MHLRLYTKLVTAACSRADTLTRHVCMRFSQMGTWWGPKNPTFWRHCSGTVNNTDLRRSCVYWVYSPSSLLLHFFYTYCAVAASFFDSLYLCLYCYLITLYYFSQVIFQPLPHFFFIFSSTIITPLFSSLGVP